MARDEGLEDGRPHRPDWDELILAYAAGELTAKDESIVEEYLASHPELAHKVALYWSLRLLVAKDQLDTPSPRAIGHIKAIFSRGVNRSPTGELIYTLARFSRARAPILVLAILGLLIFALSFGAPAVSSASPGQNLYPVKRSVESLQLALTFEPARKAELNLRLAQTRVREINDLISRKEYHLLAQSFADYESHVENAVHGLGSVPRDQPAHLETATHLEETLDQIGSSLTQLSESIPPQLKADVDQAFSKARAARAFIHAEKALVLDSEPIQPPSVSPSANSDQETPSSTFQTEPSTLETPEIPRATESPIVILPTLTESSKTFIPATGVLATLTESVTGAQGSATPTLTVTATGTVTVATPTQSITSLPTTTSTAVPTSQGTPAVGNPTIPSVTATSVAPSNTPDPTPTATPTAPMDTAVPTLIPTIVVQTHTPLQTDTPTDIPSTDTPVPTDTPTDIISTNTPVPTNSVPTDTPVPTDSAPTGTPVATDTITDIVLTDTPVPTETPTESPSPTETVTGIPTETDPLTEIPTDIAPTDTFPSQAVTATPTETPTDIVPTETQLPPQEPTTTPTETPTIEELPDAVTTTQPSAPPPTAIVETEMPLPTEPPAEKDLQSELWAQFSQSTWYSFELIHVLSGMVAR